MKPHNTYRLTTGGAILFAVVLSFLFVFAVWSISVDDSIVLLREG